ncbi:MAG: hypothetical protein JNL74_13550 [Fibrobacteres bacterium]|nr:hypothetical protein [Fibrobacterota bacterium]
MVKICIAALVAVSLVFGAKEMVVAKKEGTKVYQNKVRQMYEQPIYTAKEDETMEVLESDRELMRIKLANGKEGWIEKKSVTAFKGNKATNYTFDAAEIQGWLDNPQAVYILDMTDPNFKPIKLDKSFSDQIEENVDREKSEENLGMYRPQAGTPSK